MPPEAEINLNQTLGTSSLSIYVSGLLVTTYSFNGDFTLSERLNAVDVPFSDLSNNIDNIEKWVNLLKQFDMITDYSLTQKIVTNILRNTNKTEVTMKHENVVIMETLWQTANQYVTFQGRPEVTMEPRSFIEFVNALKTTRSR